MNDSGPSNVLDYVSSLPNDLRIKLYTSPIFAVSLPKLLDTKTTKFIFDLFLKSYSLNALKEIPDIKETLKKLLKIKLIERKGNYIHLDEIFRKSFSKGLTVFAAEKYFLKTIEKKILDEEECNFKFENILKCIVSREAKTYDFGVEELLTFGNLIDKEGNITNKGFEFLLKTKKEQLWFLILKSLEIFSSSADKQIDELEAIFELSTKNSKDVFIMQGKNERKIYRCFESLGLLEIEKDKMILSRSFISLFEKERQSIEEFIIIETNYKVYAYTQSEYKKAIVELFCDINMELPNLIRGKLTEESINQAFEKGITSEQIIHFLRSTVKDSILPPTIENQIEIWESKRNRIKITQGYLYSGFLNLSDYQKVVEFCKENNCLIECELDKRIIVVFEESHDKVKNFVKKLVE